MRREIVFGIVEWCGCGGWPLEIDCCGRIETWGRGLGEGCCCCGCWGWGWNGVVRHCLMVDIRSGGSVGLCVVSVVVA